MVLGQRTVSLAADWSGVGGIKDTKMRQKRLVVVGGKMAQL